MEFNEACVKELFKQQRADRRWRNIRFVIWIMVILLILASYLSGLRMIFGPSDSVPADAPYVALVRMDGMIMPDKNFSSENMVPALSSAFADKNAVGVIIDINSGGGSPVQASIIYDTIMRLKQQYHKKVMVVGEDMMASGAYMVAMSGDSIYVNPNTITGSIGVITEGFGFAEGMQKIGVTRRVFTSGLSKDRLDPFQPLKPEDVTKIQTLLDEVHQYFIGIVKASRGNKLKGSSDLLFSGDFWTGMRAKDLGLVDDFGDISTVMTEEFHVSHYKNYSPQPPLMQSLLSGVGTSLQWAFGENTSLGKLTT